MDQVRKIPTVSALWDYCKRMDEYIEQTGISEDEFIRKEMQNQKSTNYLFSYLMQHFEYTFLFRLNNVISIDGQQGSGKSLFGIALAYYLGQKFKQPFLMEQNLYGFEEDLQQAYPAAPPRSTHVLDEQKHGMVGLGSYALKIALTEYEEKLRYTQKNLIYISPEERDHSHYFKFTLSREPERISNKENNLCMQCPLNVRDVCFTKNFETFCPQEILDKNGGKKLEFWQKVGYPKSFTAMLWTKPEYSQFFRKRGVVTFPMVTPKTAIIYDEIKQKIILRVENREDEGFNPIKSFAIDFVNEHLEVLLVKTPRGFYKPKQKELLEADFYTLSKQTSRFTTKQTKLILALVREKLLSACELRNKEIKDKLVEKILRDTPL